MNHCHSELVAACMYNPQILKNITHHLDCTAAGLSWINRDTNDAMHSPVVTLSCQTAMKGEAVVVLRQQIIASSINARQCMCCNQLIWKFLAMRRLIAPVSSYLLQTATVLQELETHSRQRRLRSLFVSLVEAVFRITMYCMELDLLPKWRANRTRPVDDIIDHASLNHCLRTLLRVMNVRIPWHYTATLHEIKDSVRNGEMLITQLLIVYLLPQYWYAVGRVNDQEFHSEIWLPLNAWAVISGNI